MRTASLRPQRWRRRAAWSRRGIGSQPLGAIELYQVTNRVVRFLEKNGRWLQPVVQHRIVEVMDAGTRTAQQPPELGILVAVAGQVLIEPQLPEYFGLDKQVIER